MYESEYRPERNERTVGQQNGAKQTGSNDLSTLLGASMAGLGGTTSNKKKDARDKHKLHSVPSFLSWLSNFRSSCSKIPRSTKDKSILPWDDRTKTYIFGANKFDTQGKLTTDQIAREVGTLASTHKESWDPTRQYKCIFLAVLGWVFAVITATVLVLTFYTLDDLGVPHIWVVLAFAGIGLVFAGLMLVCGKLLADKITYRKLVALVRKLDAVESRYLRNCDVGIRAGNHAAWIEIGNLRDVVDHHKHLSKSDQTEISSTRQEIDASKSLLGGEMREVIRNLDVMLKENLASNTLNRSHLEAGAFELSLPLPAPQTVESRFQMPFLGSSGAQMPIPLLSNDGSNPQNQNFNQPPVLLAGGAQTSAAFVDALGIRNNHYMDTNSTSLAQMYQGLDSSKPPPNGAPMITMSKNHLAVAMNGNSGNNNAATAEDIMRVQMTAQSSGVDPRMMTPKQLAFFEKLSRHNASKVRGHRVFDDHIPLVKYESIKPESVEMFDPQQTVNLLVNANLADTQQKPNEKTASPVGQASYSSPPSELFRSNTLATRMSAQDPHLMSKKTTFKEGEHQRQGHPELPEEKERRFTFSNEGEAKWKEPA